MFTSTVSCVCADNLAATSHDRSSPQKSAGITQLYCSCQQQTVELEDEVVICWVLFLKKKKNLFCISLVSQKVCGVFALHFPEITCQTELTGMFLLKKSELKLEPIPACHGSKDRLSVHHRTNTNRLQNTFTPAGNAEYNLHVFSL